jgi:hypothetical protein
MTNSLRVSWASMVLITLSAFRFGGPRNAIKKEQGLSIPVLLLHCVPEATRDIFEARQRASAVFRQAGVWLDWQDCSPDAPRAGSDPACWRPVGPVKIQVRIVPRFKHIAGMTDGDSMGFAVADIATVSFGRVTELSLYVSRSRGQILGYVIAHEIGHVLLPAADHSPVGIMRAYWSRAVLELAGALSVAFTPEEAQAIRADVRARSAQSQATRVSVKAHSE